MPMAWWSEIAESIPRPWPREAVLYDLRWWADHERRGSGKRPGRGRLMKRWGWTEKRARAAMASVSEWADPKHGDPRPELTKVQPRSSEGPAEVQKRKRKAASNVKPRSSEGPAEVQPRSPRADIHSTQITEHTSKDGSSLRAADVWKQVNAMRSAAGKRSWGLSSSRRTALKGRIKEHGADAVLQVFQWFHTSPDAAWNRAEWKTPADTLLRPTKFLGYLEHAQTVAAAPKASQGTGAASMDPETIWQAMLSVMGRVGGRRLPAAADAPELDEQTFKRALAALGGPSRWTALCSTRPGDLHFRVRPTFVRMIQEVA